MSEQLPIYNLPKADRDSAAPGYTAELARAIGVVGVLDPALLEREDTRLLVALGAEFGAEVTADYGTPSNPVWASGAHEHGVIMSYHNGGEDGHTSVGPNGAGVPRNTLLLAGAVNAAAGQEVCLPLTRATSFYGAYAHDRYQLCGRTLLPEGQSAGHGDERLSAEAAAQRYLAAGGEPLVAAQASANVMVTAFNPYTSAQNLNYEQWQADPSDPEAVQSILGQELTAAADVLGTTSQRGPLGAIEYTAELMCLAQKDRIIQQRLQVHGVEPATITDLGQLLDFINEDAVLRDVFTGIMAGQAKFLATDLKFSDKAIRQACGQGVDELFPGRMANAVVLDGYAAALKTGASPRAVWEHAQRRAAIPAR